MANKKEQVAFELENPKGFVTQAKQIRHNDSDVGTELNKQSESISSLERTRPIFSITTLNGEYYIKIEYSNPAQSSAICGTAICGYAICGMS